MRKELITVQKRNDADVYTPTQVAGYIISDYIAVQCDPINIIHIPTGFILFVGGHICQTIDAAKLVNKIPGLETLTINNCSEWYNNHRERLIALRDYAKETAPRPE